MWIREWNKDAIRIYRRRRWQSQKISRRKKWLNIDSKKWVFTVHPVTACSFLFLLPKYHTDIFCHFRRDWPEAEHGKCYIINRKVYKHTWPCFFEEDSYAFCCFYLGVVFTILALNLILKYTGLAEADRDSIRSGKVCQVLSPVFICLSGKNLYVGIKV